MGKKTIFFCFLLTLSFGFLWAAGRQSNESKKADDPAAFTDKIDITEKKTGKWNYYLEATDKANNVSLAGPDNIFIDPASDLPRATIINPLPNMRVQGNLNIVGIAMDDDGVKSVWITVNRGKDNKGEELLNIQTEGADYWSYYLDTTNPEIWTDGVYSITAWAVDINDLSGISDDFPAKVQRKHTVYWNLDRKKPDVLVTSHEVGALVSGGVKLKGTVADGNGINALSYSTDGGIKYQPLKPSYNKKSDLYDWELNIDTKKTFEDGPKVIWFKGLDGQGSIGVNAHLLLVNNTPPDVKIIFPDPAASVCGVFSIAGYANHRIGLSSLSWKVGKDGGDIPILPGNPWWSADINIRDLKATSLDVEIRAVDVSGNVKVEKLKYKVDQNADMPTVTVETPALGAFADNKGNLVVKGTAKDNDGVSSIFYSIGPYQNVEVKTSGYFQFIIPQIPEGTHNLDIWAKDITGVIGPKVQVKTITVPAPLLKPGIATVTTGTGSAARIERFYTGMNVTLEPKIRKTMEIEIKGSSPISSATISFADRMPDKITPVAGKDQTSRAVVIVPPNLPNGFTKIEMRITDKAGREVVFPEYIFVTQNDPLVQPNPDERRGQWLDWVRPVIGASGRMVLSSTDDVLLGLANEPLERARLRLNGVGSENLSLDVDEYGRVQLKALREGSFGPLTLLLGTFNSQQFSVIADFNGPTISIIETPKDWVTTNVAFKINVTSTHRINSLAYSADMGVNWTPLLTATEVAALGAPVKTDIARNINVTDIQDGSINILIRAINDAGTESISNFTAYKDTIAPEAKLIMPMAEAKVNGTMLFGFSIKEAGALKTVTYNRPSAAGVQALTVEVFNANTWDKEYAPVFLPVMMDQDKNLFINSRMRFIFEDKAGNRSEINSWEFVLDQEYDIPVVQIVLPQDNEVITTDFIASGVMFDDDGIKNIKWKLDNGPEKQIDAKYGFSIPIPISSLTDNDHTVTVTAEDIYGVKSAPVTRKFRVSLAEPTAKVTFPRFDTVLKDVIQITGTAADKNGIKEIFISADNANTYNKAQGTENWSYRFNSRILKDGPHVVFIRVVDNYDIPATYASMINIDNTAPEIVLDSPADGSLSIGRLSLMGRVIDANLDNVNIEIRSLEGAAVTPNVRTRKLGALDTIKQDYELTGMKDGLYNIEIVSTDKAGNVSRNSRNFALARETFKNIVEIYYPLDNEKVQNNFNMYGYAGGTDPAVKVTVKINGGDKVEADVDPVSGFYTIPLTVEHLTEGNNTVVVYSDFGGYGTIQSRAQTLVYAPNGPWVTIDSFKFGDFAYERPYVSGRYGYNLSAEDQELLAAKDTDKEIKDAIRKKIPSHVEISFDNGKTFIKANKALAKNVDYRYRLETGDMYEGTHYILLRASMANGETALTRMLVQVDKTPPVIRLISPEPGGVYNQELFYSASASDDVELVSLTYNLRKGDKAAYEVPGFLQGMYLEGTIPPFVKEFIWKDAPNMPFGGGATYFDGALGLSFFDDNVKVQFQYGLLTQDLYEAIGGVGPVRYGGDVAAIKLLAGLYTLPLGSVWGPDFDWLFASFSIGANFSYFNFLNKENPKYSTDPDNPKYYTQSGEPTWLSALIFQVEFPKVTIPKRKQLRTFSLFTEGQLWFVPTDVKASQMGIKVMIPHVIMGLRIYIF
jgi:hypothetical protein